MLHVPMQPFPTVGAYTLWSPKHDDRNASTVSLILSCQGTPRVSLDGAAFDCELLGDPLSKPGRSKQPAQVNLVRTVDLHDGEARRGKAKYAWSLLGKGRATSSPLAVLTNTSKDWDVSPICANVMLLLSQALEALYVPLLERHIHDPPKGQENTVQPYTRVLGSCRSFLSAYKHAQERLQGTHALSHILVLHPCKPLMFHPRKDAAPMGMQCWVWAL